MKVEIDIPDRYDGLVQKLARSWFNGDIKKYMHYIIVESLRADMDIAWSENVLDPEIAEKYQEMLERELALIH